MATPPPIARPETFADPPLSTPDLPGTGGALRETPEDFEVEEVPAYLPCGEGEHLMVLVQKRGLTTPVAVSRLARALGVDERGAGWAGLKDRHALSTQWISLPGASAERALEAQVEGVRVLGAARHGNKLRTGHLRGNRFRLRVAGAGAFDERARAILDVLGRRGAPSYFGEQRFGHGGANVERAARWLLEGGRAPRDRFQRKLLVSSLQSALFNVATAERVTEQSLDRALDGDLMRKEDTGGLFVADDAARETARAHAWEVSATGPMFGSAMRWPERAAAEREERLLERFGVTRAHLEAFRRHGEGTRRPYRVRPTDAGVEARGQDLVVTFTLPPGAYATVVMREVMKPESVAVLGETPGVVRGTEPHPPAGAPAE